MKKRALNGGQPFLILHGPSPFPPTMQGGEQTRLAKPSPSPINHVQSAMQNGKKDNGAKSLLLLSLPASRQNY
jgi:hypothetical protein